MKDLYLEYFENSRWRIYLELLIILVRFLQILLFSEKFILSLVKTLSDNHGLTIFQKSFLSRMFFHVSLQNAAFYFFSKVPLGRSFLSFIRFYFALFCFWETYCAVFIFYYCFRDLFLQMVFYYLDHVFSYTVYVYLKY